MLAPGGTVRWFHSPSGNIECELAASYAYCQTGTPARHVELHANGRLDRCSGVACLGNGPTNATTLRYGTSISNGPFRCTSLTSGMRCVIRSSGRGFVLSRAGIMQV